MTTRPSERDRLLGEDRSSLSTVEDGDVTVKAKEQKVEGLRLTLALIYPLLGLLLTALDVTIASTVSATIAAEFDSLAIVSWLGSAYLVAVAAVQPISGKLTDKVGRRTGCFGALVLFGVGNLMCALANTEVLLVAGRVVAGLGGGAISSIGVFITSDLLPLRKRPVWHGLGSVFYAVGMGIGGVFGGFVNDTIGWRWSFMVLVPLTLCLVLAGYFLLIPGLPRPADDGKDPKSSKGIDIVGSMLLTSALVCVVLGLNLQEKGKNRVLSWILLVVAAIIFICFLVAEKWFISDPIIPLHLLANRSVTGACVAGFFISVSMHSLLFYVPILIQVRGFNTGQTGLQLLGNPLGSAIAPVLTGIAMRSVGGYAIIKPLVYLEYLIGPLGFYFSTLGTPIWATVLFMAFLGAGFGSLLTVNLTGLLANIDDRFQASSTSMLYAFRQIGASAGLAVSGIIFRVNVEKKLTQDTLKISEVLITLRMPESISKECNRHNYIGNSPPVACQIYYKALHVVFSFTLATAIAGTVFGMLIRSKSLDRDKGDISED